MSTGFVALNIFIIIALSVIFLAPAIRKMKLKKTSVKELFLQPRLEFGMLYVYLFTVCCIVVTTNAGAFDESRDPDEVIGYAEKEKLFDHQYWAYNKKLQKYRYDYEALYYFNLAHKKANETKEKFFEWTDVFNSIHNVAYYEYYELTKSKIAMERELGYFGAAATKLIHYNDKEEALKNLDSLKIKNKPFVNVLYGLCQNNTENQLNYYKKEIENNGCVKIAVEAFSRECYWQKEYKEFDYLYNNKRLLPLIPNYVKQDYAFRKGYLLDYFRFELERIFKGTKPFVVFAALLVLFLWLFFLNSIDPFEREKTKRVVFTFVISIVFFFLCGFLYDCVQQFFNFNLNGEPLNDFMYCTFVIGAIEEAVKIVPFLIVLRFTKGVTEPVDYLFYSGISALTFSVLEDIMYFNTHSAGVIYSRAIFTSLTHIADTSFIAYAMVLSRYFYKKHKVLLFAGGFLVACLSHGVYDFFILNEENKIWIVPFLILILQSWWFVHIVNNCLNNSTHFDEAVKMKTKNIGFIVCSGLFLLIVLVYMHISLTMSGDYATSKFFVALSYYFYPIFFLNVCINRIDIFKGEWNTFGLRKFVDPRVFFAGIHHGYATVPGKKIVLSAYGKQTVRLLPSLPLTTWVGKRIRIEKYKGWFSLDIQYPVVIGGKNYHSVYIRTKDDEQPLEENKRTLVGLYGLRNPELKQKEALENKDLIFLDWAFLNFIEEKKV